MRFTDFMEGERFKIYEDILFYLDEGKTNGNPV